MGRSIFCIENFTRNVDWDLGSTREGDQASGRNGKATTFNGVEMGVDWSANVVMKEEREGMLASVWGQRLLGLAACGALTFGCFAADS